ncbi:MAG TPA: hypothetical protein H9733_03255 [Candidatus Anaerotignum merdipullorum]|nr:hypothetical protein [Candidatus Anaerotignum merdipullorum]
MKSDPHGKLEVENGILQRKKCLFILFVVILATFGVGTYQSYTQPDGSTVESQIKMANGTSAGTERKISQEQELENYLLISIYSGNKSGIAVFEPS